MFELSEHLNIKKEVFLDSIIYTIDNFYKNPDIINNYLFKNPAPLHKQHESPTHNNIYFEDRRLQVFDGEIEPVVIFLSKLISKKPSTFEIITNQTRFYKHSFNDYQNCIWCPHYDYGYNGIVYFNKNDSKCGTTLYSPTEDEDEIDYYYSDIPEHSAPWRKKEKYEIIKTLEPKYNRLVLFDGYKFSHGMNIINDRYFSNEYRNNQVFFFERA